MLDVHPPHEAAHTWKDFLIHIATICIGLLIAIGLEQTVETIHHRRQRIELRESLIADAKQGVKDTEDAHAYVVASVQWLELRIHQVQQALATNQPLPPAPPRSPLNFASPDEPVWKAAKSSGLEELLTQEEVEVFTDVDGDVINAERYHLMRNDDMNRVWKFNYKFTRADTQQPDFSDADRQDLKEYLDALATSKTSTLEYDFWCKTLHGAQAAVLRGKRDLASIQHAELDPW